MKYKNIDKVGIPNLKSQSAKCSKMYNSFFKKLYLFEKLG